jgi:hypothetical protein
MPDKGEIGRPCRPESHRPLSGLNTYSVGVSPCRWPRTARLYRGMSLAQTPPGLPLTRRLPGRGSLVGGSRRGSPCQARSATRSAAAPASGRAWSTFGPHAIGAERFVAVSSGLQPYIVRPGRRSHPGKRALGLNPDKDGVALDPHVRLVPGAAKSGAPGLSRGRRRWAAQNGGWSLKSPPRSACRSRPLDRSPLPRWELRSTFAVAHFREAPTSSASISVTDRLSPSGVSQLR